MIKQSSILLLCGLVFQTAFSQVKLPRLVKDSMILQRDTKINIWGWAAKGEKVNVKFRGMFMAAMAAGPVYTLPGKKDLGTPKVMSK